MGLHILQHIVEIYDILIMPGVMLLQILEKIILMIRADTAGAGLSVQPPYVQVIGIGVLPLPLHLDEWKSVLEHFVMTGE